MKQFSKQGGEIAPLSGIRVLEIGSYIAGPFCGTQLGDLGAEVTKIEDPKGGDHKVANSPVSDQRSVERS